MRGWSIVLQFVAFKCELLSLYHTDPSLVADRYGSVRFEPTQNAEWQQQCFVAPVHHDLSTFSDRGQALDASWSHPPMKLGTVVSPTARTVVIEDCFREHSRCWSASNHMEMIDRGAPETESSELRNPLVKRFECPALLLMIFFSGLLPVVSTAEESLDYGRDVRPILSQFCFKCHGPDDTKREAGLRLDTFGGATSRSESGTRAIVPREPSKSELIRRIHASDPSEQMPPPSTKMSLTDAQKEILAQWISAGAEYKPHWSFVTPQQPAIPPVRKLSWTRGAIDSFVLARLEAERLSPSVEADRFTLIRRASLDLVGLPPTIEEADEFVNDPSPDAYEKLLDRLLASPHYGERWARRWLDLARYADTNGYEKDRTRSIWPYRDWVINALNANLPFNQFTIEQIAGDMLPHATIDQRIATGFHRNTMLNEEGGIDPLEFRFHAMTDRVSTTATTWLGLTLGCAQCHTHKYDPITHRDYYNLFALLNNADEPEIDVVRTDIAEKRNAILQQIADLEADLLNRFPLPDIYDWTTVRPVMTKSENGARLEVRDDASIFVNGASPETDAYEIVIDSDLTDVIAIRLEALSDPKLPSKGPGRTPHGNFVLGEITATAVARDVTGEVQRLKFARATADFSQESFPVEKAIDGDTKTGGWAIHGPGEWNVNRTATFVLASPGGISGKVTRWTIRLEQPFGKQHTLGKFRLSFGRRRGDSSLSESERRIAHRNQKFEEWLTREEQRVVKWTTLKPIAAKSNLPLLTIQDDQSIFATGDISKRDIYDLSFENNLQRVTAIRIEALPDDRLPQDGPGLVYYEGPRGDFFLSEVTFANNGQPVKLTAATQSFANGNNTAAMALDGNQQTGWSINGGQGKPHVAVFRLERPLDAATRLDLTLLFERYYAAPLGRFRVSATDDVRPVEATAFPMSLEADLLTPRAMRSAAQQQRLLRQFAEVAPELAVERQKIVALRQQMPAFPTTLAFQERPQTNPRHTYRHHRGEFLQPKEEVTPAVLSALPQLSPDKIPNRLAFAEWLVDSSNPLTGRVTVNRQWAAFFGRGLVRTSEDFGSQGASPTHPALLNWLASEFVSRSETAGMNWDMKHLHHLIASSATYRQSSRVTPELLARDLSNELLARGPRFRLEAELIRDSALAVSGLMSEKLGGPSVFPAQPANITTEGTYGGLNWTVSPGEDRYRRTLYTFTKRTAPFAMSQTFDGPSGEACVARREVSNTPMQALTLLNDTVFVETAQALGREFAAKEGPVESRLQLLFRRTLTRPATVDELLLLKRFHDEQAARLDRKELDAAKLAGSGSANETSRAVWTLIARAIMNLDEAVTRN